MKSDDEKGRTMTTDTTTPSDASDDAVGAEPSTDVWFPEKLPLAPRIMIDWDRTHVTAEFIRALAKAQSEVTTVTNDSVIKGREAKEGREGTRDRQYTGADAMVSEARRALSANEIAWVCASISEPTTEPRHLAESTVSNQWVCSVVTTESVLFHAAQDGEISRLVIRGETASIGRTGTPIDKADKAAETYLRLYLARDLLALDRGKTDDDIEPRDSVPAVRAPKRDGAATVTKPISSKPPTESATKAAIDDMFRRIADARKAAQMPRLSPRDLLTQMFDKDFDIRSMSTSEAFLAEGTKFLQKMLDDQQFDQSDRSGA
jgi:hypothetical protein